MHVVDTYAAPQTLLAEHSIPLVPHTGGGNTLDYNVGNLPAGGSGLIILRQHDRALQHAAGHGADQHDRVNSGNDGNAVNNTAVATVTVPLLPPLLTGPLAGTTCTNTVTIEGWVQPGAAVDLYVDNVLVAADLTTEANGNGLGDWTYVVSLPDGSHNHPCRGACGQHDQRPIADCDDHRRSAPSSGIPSACASRPRTGK